MTTGTQTSPSQEILAAAQRWAQAFNDGDAKACAACYTEDARMQAVPLADVRGRAAIEGFWANLIEAGYTNVRYLDAQIRFESDDVAYLRSPWAMNKASGLIHKERWERRDGQWLLADDHFEILENADTGE